MGSSQDPGTDWMTMLDALTPEESSLAFVPARRGSIMAVVCGQRGVRWRGEPGRTGVPASVDNANAQAAAIMLLWYSGAFEGCHN
jgi:hypothetical protein